MRTLLTSPSQHLAIYTLQRGNPRKEDAMFERYTEAARRVVVSSKHKASHVGSREIDTEHLLLGLLSKDQTLAHRFLGTPWAADLFWRRIEQSGKIRAPIKGPCDLPLSSLCKRALSYAAEEADGLSSKRISTEHLLLGLLREEKCFAAEYLYERGIRLASVREELKRAPHKYSALEQFVREPALPEDVVEQQKRVRAIFQSAQDAVARHDLAKGRQHADEERIERDKLARFISDMDLGFSTGSMSRIISARSQLT